MDNVKVLDLMDRCVDITQLPIETRAQLQKFYFEMPTGVRMDISLHFRDIFPEVTAKMFLHISTSELDTIIKMSSDLLKIFNNEYRDVRFYLPAAWFERMKETVFMESWCNSALTNGLNKITDLYAEALAITRRNRHILQFMANFLEAWLLQKERGQIFYMKIFHTEEFSRLTQSPMSLSEIVSEYLQVPATNVPRKVALEKLFYAKIQMNPVEDETKNIFFILDILSAAGITADRKYNIMLTMESAAVSNVTDSDVSDNLGQVSIFGHHDFGSISIDLIKEELLRLNRNTISDYLGRKTSDTVISFDISDQVKMMLQEELSPNICAVSINRGNEVDMATLLILEGKTYLLFRKSGVDNATFGISLGKMENGDRELLGISNESEFTYSLVGGEEIGIK